MSTDTAHKLQNELSSLQGLVIINLMCSAFGFAFGAYFLMPNLVLAATTLTFPPLDQLGLMVLGGLAFAVAFKWIFSTIQIMEPAFDLGNSLKQHRKDNTLDEEALTGIIIDLLAAYRENKPTLKLMVTISKVACAAFALMASLQLISLAFSGIGGMQLWLSLLSIAICYGVAAACYLLPHFFSRYSAVWDKRLTQTEKAQAALQKVLGEP
ncbi:MAG: hypothetical protein NWE93_10865 [Candidatus Bathyarchaeota archaeon]|nr:hypothetical protein [Candidatus Bathyarchaeota archaeon]